MRTNENPPLVSVIIPNYNHAAFLSARIESVLNQSYSNIEVIILDDCSIDNSRNVIQQYKDNPKIKHIIFNEVNSGSTFKQWNKGFSLAQGKYVWIAESDDVADKNFLSELISNVILDDSIVLAASGITLIDENDNITGYFNISDTSTVKKYSNVQFIRHMAFGNKLINASSAIFKRETALIISDDYTQLKISGDYLFWIKIAEQGNVIEVPKHLDYFRRHTQTVTPKMIASGIAAQEDIIVFKHICNLKNLNKLLYHIIIGFRIWSVKESNDFNTPDIKRKVIRLWKDNSLIPFIDIMLWKIYRFFSSIKYRLKVSVKK